MLYYREPRLVVGFQRIVEAGKHLFTLAALLPEEGAVVSLEQPSVDRNYALMLVVTSVGAPLVAHQMGLEILLLHPQSFLNRKITRSFNRFDPISVDSTRRQAGKIGRVVRVDEASDGGQVGHDVVMLEDQHGAGDGRGEAAGF